MHGKGANSFSCAAKRQLRPMRRAANRWGKDTRGIGFYFFVAGVLCITLGMVWGIHMAVSGDHAMAGALPTSIWSAGSPWVCSACIIP